MSIRDHLEAFLDHVQRLEETDAKGEDGYFKEYTQLRLLTQKYRQKQTIKATEGKKEYNIKKNRYKDIVPYDYTRVKLSNEECEDGRDYINANFIKNASGQQGYIAAQGPLPQTVDDFVRMLWEYDVKVVIMACNEYEAGKHKCQRYWPNDQDDELTFGPVTIKLGEMKESEVFTERQLFLCVDGEPQHTVNHFHFPAWPDHMAPTSVDTVLDVIAEARTKQPNITKPPLVVHCSAGCGRTGTIIAVDFIWSLLKYAKLDKTFNIFEIIKSMRRQRPSVVQSPEQYIFLHFTIKQLFEQHLKIMDGHIYENCTTNAEATGGNTELCLYQDVGEMKANDDPVHQTLPSIEPKSPSRKVIEQTCDKLLELEFSSPGASGDPEGATHDPETALYANPTPQNKPAKPSRPPMPVFENDNFSYPPPLPPKTEEASQLVDDDDSEKPEPNYTNTKPPPISPNKPKPLVNGKRPNVPNFKPDQKKPETNPFRQSSGLPSPKPNVPSSKPNFMGTQPLVPTPAAPKPSTNPLKPKAPISNTPREGYMNVIPKQDNGNVSLVSVSANESQVVQTNRESTLEKYSAISDYMSGRPVSENSGKNSARDSTLDPPDYGLVKNPVYGDPDRPRALSQTSQTNNYSLASETRNSAPSGSNPSSESDYHLISDFTSGSTTEPYALEKRPLGTTPSYEYVAGKKAPVKPTLSNDYQSVGDVDEYELAKQPGQDYAYADEKQREKWAFQHIALRNEPPAHPAPPPKPARSGASEGDPGATYEPVHFDQNDEVFDEDVRKSMHYDVCEGSDDEDNISVGGTPSPKVANNIGTVTRAFGQVFRKKPPPPPQEEMKFNFGTLGSGLGSSSSTSSPAALSSEDMFSINNIRIFFKRAEVSFPKRVNKPTGQRLNPNDLKPNNPPRQ